LDSTVEELILVFLLSRNLNPQPLSCKSDFLLLHHQATR